MRCSRENVKGHILRKIVTRVDYRNVFGLSKESIKSIFKVCRAFGLTEQSIKEITESDFELNDPINFASIPQSYMKSADSYLFYDPRNDFTLEINHLFLRITQDVKGEYKKLSVTLSLVSEVLKVLFDLEEIQIRRLSISKVNQVFFKQLKNAEEIFKSEVIGTDQHRQLIDWNKPNTRSHLTQNFEFGSNYVNAVRVFDNGEMDSAIVFRLLLTFETYSFLDQLEGSIDQILSKLRELNDSLFVLFESSFTDEGIKKLVNGERLGDFDEPGI